MIVWRPLPGLSGQMKRAKLRNPSAAGMEKMKEGRRVAALCLLQATRERLVETLCTYGGQTTKARTRAVDHFDLLKYEEGCREAALLCL